MRRRKGRKRRLRATRIGRTRAKRGEGTFVDERCQGRWIKQSWAHEEVRSDEWQWKLEANAGSLTCWVSSDELSPTVRLYGTGRDNGRVFSRARYTHAHTYICNVHSLVNTQVAREDRRARIRHFRRSCARVKS